MSLPRFPESRRIALEDKPLFDRLFARRPPRLSAYTFTNLFAWSEPYNTRAAVLEDGVIVWHETDGRMLILEPIGAAEPRRAIEECLRLSPKPAVFERICSETAELFSGDPSYRVTLDRDNSDYVYLSADLIDLPGRKYDAKRNFINRFPPDSFEYVRMTAGVAEECLRFAHEWCEDRSCDTVEGLRRERCAVFQMLTHFDYLGVRGGAIRMGGRVAAFSLAEALNPDTLVIHVEKADPGTQGLYQLINNRFCAAEAREFKYVNREQDLGVPGLRKAKESYHPVRLENAYTIAAE